MVWLFLLSLSFHLIAGCSQQSTSISQVMPYVPSEHRIPEKEGWAWSESLVYNKSSEFPMGHNFTDLHAKMKRYVSTLYQDLGIKPTEKNICIARFSVILKNSSDNTTRLFNLSDGRLRDPFEDHVFISGAELISKAVKKQKDKSGKDAFVFSYKRENFDQKEDDLSENMLEKIQDYYCSYQYSSEQNKRYIFFHPTIEDYGTEELYQLPYIVEKLCRLYEHREEPLPVMAYLARRWAEIDKKASTLETIAWYSIAGAPGPYHGDNNATQPDSIKAVFFERNQDSEQKLLFYLNMVTDALKEFKVLEQAVNGLINILMSITSYKSLLRQSYEKEIAQKKTQVSDQILALMKKREPLSDVKKGDRTDHIDKLKKHEQENRDAIKKIQSELRLCEEKTALLADATSTIPKYQDIINAQKWLTKRIRDLFDSSAYHSTSKKELSKVANEFFSLLDDASPENWSTERIQKIHEKLQELNEKIKHYVKVDKVLEDFRQQITDVLQANVGYTVESIVLNVHNALDSCYSCASDFAQELRRRHGFVDYFKELVADIQKGECQKLPSFVLVSSCGDVRLDKWCKNFCGATKHNNIVLSPQAPISYYQCFFSDKMLLEKESLDMRSPDSENPDFLPTLEKRVIQNEEDVKEKVSVERPRSRKKIKVLKRVKRVSKKDLST